MNIDLDDKEIIFNVRIGGKDHALHEPNADQLGLMFKRLNTVKSGKAEYSEIDIMKNFVIELGLPSDLAGKLTIGKLNLLFETMMEGLTKKK